ncbi:MAG: hypothetical protein WA130_09925 [Candidatus Methanoperedens sp.]
MKTIITLNEALEKIKQLKNTYYFRRESEKVALPDSVGREISEDIIAEISGKVYAGDGITKIKSCEAMAIATGAILPEGADAVLKIEDADAGETVFHRVAIRPGKPCAVGIVNDTPVFALPGKPTGAFTALEIVVRRYFTDMPRAMHKITINEDVVLPEKGFEYILFMKIVNNTAIGYGKDKLFDREYNTAMISASPRSCVVEGYVITDRNIGKGELVNVYLFC